MDFIEIETLVRSTFDPRSQVETEAEVRDSGDLALSFTSSSRGEDRERVRWVIYAGLEVFSFWFDEFWAMDFDYDVNPGDKSELLVMWARLTEAYLRGEGSTTDHHTAILRRPFRQLALSAGDDSWLLSSRPPLFSRR